MKGWLPVALSVVASVFNGKTPPMTEHRTSGHPVLKIKDVDATGVYRGKYDSFVDYDFASSFRSKWIQGGDILILNAAHNSEYVGTKIYYAELRTSGALPTGEWLLVRPNSKKLDARFAYHWVKAPGTRRRLQKLVKGIHLYPKDVGQLNVSLPSMAEQRGIAAILDQAEALRRKRQQTLDKIGSMPIAIFREMFQIDNYGGEQVEYEPLGEHLSFITSGGRNWAKFYASSGRRFLRSLDVQMNEISDEEVVFVTPPDSAEARRTRVEKGDVLLTITGSRIGRVAAVPDELAGSHVSQHVGILRMKPSVSPVFLAFYLSLDEGGQRQIAKAQYGQTKPGLNFKQIREFSIPVPPLRLQEEFVARCRVVGTVADRQRAQLDKLDGLCTCLEERAFSGELTSKLAARELEMTG